MTLPIIQLFLLYFAVTSCSTPKEAKKGKTAPPKETVTVRDDFKRYFDECAVEGSLVIYDCHNHQWILSDTVGTNKQTLPASTFKIINLLIALETKTIASEHEVVNWVGSTDTTKYGYRPEIYRNMTVKEAFEESAGWVFIELAKKIGRANYKKYLSACHYGNLNLSQPEPDFWNFGDFAISPRNQAMFIKALYEEKLPFSKRSMNIVKQVMITEQTSDYTIRAKTGWTRENNINTGWWTGYITTKKGTYVFATRLLQNRSLRRSDFGPCRKEITRKVFRDLGLF